MTNECCISVIVPMFNASKFIKKTLLSLIDQDFKEQFEVIIVDDCSTDNSLELAKSFNNPKIKIYSLNSNSGPASARNFGLQNANGKYISFLDADDLIHKEMLSKLYQIAVEKNYDLVFCDHEWIENNVNQRKNCFSYEKDKEIKKKDLLEEMKFRIHNPLHVGGPLSSKGKLIKNSFIMENKIRFEENLRYLEDEIFMWQVLANVKNLKFLRKQYYLYNVNPNISTAVTQGINFGFSVEKFKIIKNHIKQSFKILGVKDKELEDLGDQAFIYFIINVLISYCKSILQKKVKKEIGQKILRSLIVEILSSSDVSSAIKKYKISKNESYWIPKFIMLKLTKFLEISCFKRANKIIKIRNSNFI